MAIAGRPDQLVKARLLLGLLFLQGPEADAAMVAVSDHTMMVDIGGQLLGSGSNDFAQLGLGDLFTRTTFCTPAEPGIWQAVAAGPSVTFAIKADGSLWASGGPNYDILGVGVPAPEKRFVRVGQDNDWSRVAAGSGYAIGRRTNGSLWVWGSDYLGSLGLGPYVPTQYVPVQIGSETNWREIDAGSYHNLAVKTDGSLWAWGYNSNGRLGTGGTTNLNVPTRIGTLTGWTKVSAGESHSLAIRSDGSLWAWGRNTAGQLGTGGTTTVNSPTQVGTETGWVAASAGSTHSLAIKSDGSLWAWGNNAEGKLGLGDTTNRLSPTRVGTANDWECAEAGRTHSAAVRTNGEVWLWGSNAMGQLGAIAGSPLVPTLASLDPVPDISVSNMANPFLNSQLVSSGAFTTTITLPTTTEGSPEMVDFTVLNHGSAPLVVTEVETESGFVTNLPVPVTLAPGESALFSVILDATLTGDLASGLTIHSNDPDESVLRVNLKGTVYSFQTDTDGDGLSDAGEFRLSSLGFNVKSPDPALIAVLHGQGHRAGLVSAVQPGTLLFKADAASGKASFVMRLEKATSLADFTGADVTGATVDGSGRLLVPQPRAETREFFRFAIEPPRFQP